ncbi:MAG TPA: metallophosphoesterase [Syntrophorhabdales bacterium]|nr:metallophosphoesterase [Syntrophorhabdales bacterium]
MKNKRRAIFIGLVLLLLPLLARAEEASFAVISDTHIGLRESVYITFIQAVEEQKIRLIIHTGDAINRPGDLIQWARFLQITGPGKELHVAPGNHDIDDKESLAVFLKYFSEPYHSFSDGDTLFLLLNTELPGQRSRIEGKQLAWLEAELQRPFKYKFVFLHEPPFPVVHLHGLDRHREPRDRLHQLFVRTGVSLVVAGHDHLYDRKVKDGITYVILGGGGGQLAYILKNSDFYHYMVASRSNGGYLFTLKDISGSTRDQFSVNR